MKASAAALSIKSVWTAAITFLFLPQNAQKAQIKKKGGSVFAEHSVPFVPFRG
jgi:hypothetical protein